MLAPRMGDLGGHDGRVMAGLSLAVVDAARAVGVDLADVLDAHRVDPAVLVRSDAYVPVALHEALWAEGARRSGDPHFALRAAERITPGQTGVVEYLLRNCTTLEDAALTWVRHASVVSDCLEGAFVTDGDALRLEWRLARPMGEGATQWSMFAQARALRLMRDALGDATLAPREVWFRHAAPADDAPLVAYLRAPVRYGRPTAALLWDRAVRDRPLRWIDPDLRAALEERTERLRRSLDAPAPDVPARVEAALRALLAEPRRDLRLPVVAERLGIAPRTLQLRLAEAGRTFRGEVARVRAEAAQQLAAGRGASVSETARALGFADASSFRRARRGWDATAPAQGPRSRKR